MDKQKNNLTTTSAATSVEFLNFLVVSLDDIADQMKNIDCISIISKLQNTAKDISTFTDVDECISFLSNIKEDKTFLISSSRFGQIGIPKIHSRPQGNSIYIFCVDKGRDTQWVQNWSKVGRIFTDIKPICEELKMAVQQCDPNLVPISFVAPTEEPNRKTVDELHHSFMYTQILKEILLSIDFKQQHNSQFVKDYQKRFVLNEDERNDIDKLKQEYRQHEAIWWYTSPTFPYTILNRALRLMEVDLIISLGFFIQDLHQSITKLHIEQDRERDHSKLFTVFRGQGLSQTDFDQLTKTQGGLLSFNSFLSSSSDYVYASAMAESNSMNPDLIGILFQITAKPSNSFKTTFADITEFSSLKDENEILFSMHSIFRIGEIERIGYDNRLWKVQLTLTADNDQLLEQLTKCIEKETFPERKGWYRLGSLLCKLGQFEKAQQLFEFAFNEDPCECGKARFHHSLGTVKDGQGKHEEAIVFYQKAIEFYQTYSCHSQHLASSYCSMGVAYTRMGDLSKALSLQKKALEIIQKDFPEQHPNLAVSYNNIGAVYHEMGDHSRALESYEKLLEIIEKTLPENHPSRATSHSNMGTVYMRMGKYSAALDSYEKAMKIRQKTLPEDHRDLATSYNNIGGVYQHMGDYSIALDSYKKAMNIEEKALPKNHSGLATSYNNIGALYFEIGEYPSALDSYTKALAIRQETLPKNHSDLADSYNNIGMLYFTTGNYSKALSCLNNALAIQQEALSPNHPDLTISYNNIGLVYGSSGDYLRALTMHKKGLAIAQMALPEDHPSLATSYGNIAFLYSKMAEYSTAILWNETALKIREKVLVPNHPELATSYKNIGTVYTKMEKYCEALSLFEKALKIEEKVLPAGHFHLANSYNNIGAIYFKTNKYSEAFLWYKKALEIYQKNFPPDHPHLITCHNNIALAYEKMSEYSREL